MLVDHTWRKHSVSAASRLDSELLISPRHVGRTRKLGRAILGLRRQLKGSKTEPCRSFSYLFL